MPCFIPRLYLLRPDMITFRKNKQAKKRDYTKIREKTAETPEFCGNKEVL